MRLKVMQATISLIIAVCSSEASALCPPGFSSAWGSRGGQPGQFREPYGVAVGPAGTVFVVDTNNQRIQSFSADGIPALQWGSRGSGDGQFNSPVGVATDDAGFVYVSDSDNHRIQKFSSTGAFQASWNASGYLLKPLGLAVSQAGELYVADYGRQTIEVFDTRGVWLRHWSLYPYLPPVDVAVRGSEVYVANYHQNLIQVFSETGIPLREWNIGNAAGGAFGAYGVAVGDNGRVLVTAATSNKILQFDSLGNLQASWNGTESAVGPISVPRGIDERFGSLYVVEASGERVARFLYPAPQQCAPPPPPPQRIPLPTIAIHLVPVGPAGSCSVPTAVDCATAVTRGSTATPSGPFYFAYVLVAPGQSPRLGGVEFGISYERDLAGDLSNGHGIDVFGWTSCGTLQFPTSTPREWPAPGSGNRVTWTAESCPTTQTGVAGYFYLGAYSQDRLVLTAHPLTNGASVADCGGGLSTVSVQRLGYASFSASGTVAGCNPCISSSCLFSVAVEPSTWGGIKARFGGVRTSPR